MTGQGAGVAGAPPSADAAVAAVLGKAAGENFPVALRLLPPRHREHLMAVYVFARTADDIGDLAPVADRSRLLAALDTDVRLLYATLGERREVLSAPEGRAEDRGAVDHGAEDHGAEEHGPRFAAVRGLARTVTECQIPMAPFIDLIRANQQDQVVTSYETFDDLLGYCRLSANPVGRIVLHVFGSFSADRAQMSDDICTGLQLAEHWQDVAEDLRSGRVYVPACDLRDFGCTEADLAQRSAPPRVRELMAFEVSRARKLIHSGAPLIGTLRGAARAAVAGYVAGGRAALAAIAAADYDVLAATPRPGRGRTAAELVAAFARGR